jgi:hypothetical protein
MHNYTLARARYRSMVDWKLPVLAGRGAGGVSMVSALVGCEFAILLPSMTLATAMSRNNMASTGHGQFKYEAQLHLPVKNGHM